MTTFSLVAPGAPGIEPRWTSSAKDGIGTAYSSSSNVWFTLSHGIVNELYYPTVDVPNTRDLQLLITDGKTFCHEEKRDLEHRLEYPEKNVLLYRITSTDRKGRYRLIKEIVGEAHSPVFLLHTRLEIIDPSLQGQLKLYALLAPHVKGTGRNNSAQHLEIGGRRLLHAHREDIHLVFGCQPDFLRRSVGYVGVSDGWQDLMDNFTMDWDYESAIDGNVALLGEIDLSCRQTFTLSVAFGASAQSAATQFLQALVTPFSRQREKFITQWNRSRMHTDLSAHTGDSGSMARLSLCILLAHEDKVFPGAFVASLSIPWGETKDDSDRGGYHLVWARDMVHTASALLACDEIESPLRALVWLSCIQGEDGCVPQNSSIEGEAYWKGIQLDEVAMPILLAWRLQRSQGLRDFDPWTLVSRAARYLIHHGPVTEQDRWEENAGYSPSTLAAVIAGLVCAAEFARQRNETPAADFYLAYADWLESHVDEWTSTTRGELLAGKPHHYLRITPAPYRNPIASPSPDTASIQLANGGGLHPARNIVGGDFLQLVRLGIRDPHTPLVVDSIAVIDHVIKRDLPQGPCWRRYNFDGYGQKPDGQAFDGTGEGRPWPILTGERGHYELAAGRDPLPWIKTIEGFANEGGMIPEQVWDADDQPQNHLIHGGPTGAAMPLCWSHAEYLCLVRSRQDGIPFDRPEPVYERYVRSRTSSALYEIWTPSHQIASLRRGQKLRIITSAPVSVRWSADQWQSVQETEASETIPGCWCVDLPTSDGPTQNDRLVFTFRWSDHWEGRDFHVRIESSST